MKKLGEVAVGSQGVPKIFRAPIYGAHCVVICAIAQLSCDTNHACDRQTDGQAELPWYIRAIALCRT